MAMKTREDALFNAYLNNYKAAQAQAVNSGVQATQAARQRGAALLNATDKTLPVLKNQLADVGTAAVAGANNDFKLAQQAAAMANDQFTKKLQDDADLAIQKQHEVWYLAKQAEKAAKAAKSSSSSKSGSVTTDSDSYAAMAAAADNLTTQGSTAAKDVQTKPLKGKDTQRSNAERNASARARYDGSEQEKSDIKYRVRQKREQTVQMLKDKQAAANAGANKGKPGGNSYAERQSAAQPAQSVATRRAGNLVGSTTAAAGQASSIRERRRAKATRNDWASVQKDTATALQRLQTDADYRAELGTPGRQLTQAEINAVNQYGQNAGDLYKQVQGGIISLDDYNTQAQALARMNQKASLNGMGQDLQAATAGFMRSFPLQKQSEQAFTDWADDQTSGKYSQAIDNGVLPALVPTLDKYAEQAPLAAMGGAMAGKMAQYNAFNQLVDGTGYADAAQKAGGKLYDAAKKIPVLNRIVQPGFGEAAGRVLADTGADFVLDTYPSMMDDMDKFSADRQTAARGENVDDPMTVGRMAANAAKNLAGNVAMNALPEIGSAVLNGAKNSFSGAMLDEPLQEAAAVAGKSSRLDTRPDLPRADTPAAVDLEKNADAFLRDANSADAVKSVPDSTAANFTSTPQNAAQGLADSAADAPGVAVRERGYAASLRTNSDLPDAEIQAFKNIPAGDSQAIADAMEQVGNRLAKQYPVSALSKLAEARRLGFLLNPRTHIRNIAANVAQLPVTGVSDKVSAALQSLYAKTGKSTAFVQTKALHVDKTSRDVAEQVWNQVKDTIDGSSSYEQPISDAVKNAEVFKLGEGQQHNILANAPGMKKGAQALEAISQKFTGKNVFDQLSSGKSVLENIRQFTYGLLELGDAPFVKKHFTESLANIAAANKISSADKITSEMIAQATQDAMRATYKDDNDWTELFSSVHKLGGVGEVVMPFTKTPANMVARSLDYSPVGLAKGVKDFYTKGGNPAEYIDEIAKGLTGSAGMALGAALYKSGVLTGAESDNANKRAFDKQNGFLPFAIHVPGTNVYYRISDFQPSMMSVITGAAWAQAASGDETPEQAAKGAVVAFTNTLADNSNLSNIGDLFGNYDGLGGGLWDAALGLPQSMVPSLSNAIAKSTDTTVRNPYDATDPIQSQKNQIMAKIPGLSKELPAAYDTWGAEKLRDNAAFEQFLDPAAFTNQTTSSRDKEIQRLYEATGDIGVYPPSIKNGTDVDGLKLDNTQTSEYQRTAGQLNRQIVDEVMRTDEYRQADDATRVKMLKSAYEIGREAGKEAANPDYVSENSDYLAYKENGIRDALLTSSVGAVLDKARNEKREATGNADANLNKVERWNAIPSLDSYDDMVSAYLLNSSDDTAQKLYDKAGAEATAAYLDIYTATAKNGEDDDSANQLQTLQTALPVLRKYDMTTDQQMDVASMFLQKASPAIRVQEQYGSDMALKYLDAYTKADADGNGKVSDTEFKNALLQSPGLSDDDIGKIYLSSKTTDDSTDEKAQTFSATYGPAGVTNYLYLQYLERAYHTAEANRKIAAGEGGNPDGSFNKSDLVNALNYMNLTNEERRAYFSIVAPTWKNPY